MTNDFWYPSSSISGPGHWRTELEQLRGAQRRAIKNRWNAHREVREEVAELRGELEFVTLLLGALIAELDHKGQVTREDLRSLMVAVDHHDGKLDGRLPVAALQELLRPDVLEELPEDDSTPDSAAPEA